MSDVFLGEVYNKANKEYTKYKLYKGTFLIYSDVMVGLMSI